MSTVIAKSIEDRYACLVRSNALDNEYYVYGPGYLTKSSLIIHVVQIGIHFGLGGEQSFGSNKHTFENGIQDRAILTSNVFLGADGRMVVDLNGRIGMERIEHVISAYKKLTQKGRSVSWRMN